MTQPDRLHPWCIIRHLPRMQRVVAGRFRRRNEAEAHLKMLQRMTPDASYAIIFDVVDDRLDLLSSDVVVDRWLQGTL